MIEEKHTKETHKEEKHKTKKNTHILSRTRKMNNRKVKEIKWKNLR